MRRICLAMLLATTIAIVGGCGGSGNSSATEAKPNIVVATTSTATTALPTTTTAAPTTTTAPPARSLGAKGSVYGLERGGDLIEYVLAAGTVRRWKVPEQLRVADAKNLVILADGLALYNRVGDVAAIFPRSAPDQPVVVDNAVFVGSTVDVWTANKGGAVDLIVYDGSGLAVGHLLGRRPEGGAGSVVLLSPDRLLFADLTVVDLSSRQADHIGTGALVGRSDSGVAGQSCDQTSCTVTVYNWAGGTERSARLDSSALSNQKQSVDSTNGRSGSVRGGLLSPDGKFLVFGWLGKVTEPGEVRRLDFTTGQVATLASEDGFPQPAALTEDGGTALISTDSRTGAFQLVSLADPTQKVSVELGASVLALTAGPSTGTR